MVPNIVHLVKPGERKKRVANVAQLKPFYQELTDDDGEKPGPMDALRVGEELDRHPSRNITPVLNVDYNNTSSVIRIGFRMLATL